MRMLFAVVAQAFLLFSTWKSVGQVGKDRGLRTNSVNPFQEREMAKAGPVL